MCCIVEVGTRRQVALLHVYVLCSLMSPFSTMCFTGRKMFFLGKLWASAWTQLSRWCNVVVNYVGSHLTLVITILSVLLLKTLNPKPQAQLVCLMEYALCEITWWKPTLYMSTDCICAIVRIYISVYVLQYRPEWLGKFFLLDWRKH